MVNGCEAEGRDVIAITSVRGRIENIVEVN